MGNDNAVVLGQPVRVIIEDHEIRDQRKVDGAVVTTIHEDGSFDVKCDDYRGTANDGSGAQSDTWHISHFKGREPIEA